MGFVLNQHPYMDIPTKCNIRTYAIQDPGRGDIFLCCTDLQHLSPLSPSQQADLPSDLPSRTEAITRQQANAAMEMDRDGCCFGYNRGRCYDDCKRRQRLLHGLDICLGWPIHFVALVSAYRIHVTYSNHNDWKESRVPIHNRVTDL